MDPAEPSKNDKTPAKLFENIKLDFNTIKIVLLTAAVLLVLLAAPMVFILKHFVTFDQLDDYLGVTKSVGPKILHTILEDFDSGYSKNFLFDSDKAISSADTALLFHALAHEKVTMSVTAHAIGAFPKIVLKLNNCVIDTRAEEFHIFEREVTADLERCSPDEPNLHSFKIDFPNGVGKSTVEIRCVVLVNNRIRPHI
ncbi:MAG: hypothetical protein LAP61_16010 [Acidobacteriia bacterium]|nr:hypothetical protein [Terriglobia bacterium]